MASTGNRGKFSERMKKILLFKRKKKNDLENIEIQDSNKIYINFLKVAAAIPGFVYGAIADKNTRDNKDNQHLNINSSVVSDLNNINGKANEFKLLKNDDIKKKNRDKISNINVDLIRKNQEVFFMDAGIKLNDKFDKEKNALHTSDNVNKIERAKELEKSIINLIKKDLIRIVNEMEILQSDLYILSEVNGESKVLKDCQRELDQVKAMICKIDKLKEKYDFLRDNFDFEYLLEVDNNDLVDKIIELKDTFGNNELKAVSEDYKLLDVYKYLYLKIDDLQEKTSLFEKRKKDEELKLKERDIDFEKLKRDVYNVDYINRNYDSFVKSQNELLREIDENVNKINSYEHVDLHLKGFNELFRNSFKYFGLLMVSPLKGIIPSIATETLITGNLIKNLYKNLEWEENRKKVYEAMDYSSIISNAISDLDGTSRIVDSTLDDIVRLKMKYNDNFKKYQGDFLEYRETMHKINDMENKILGNKIKIEMMKKRALDQKRANDKKLMLVKKLNEKENHK